MQTLKVFNLRKLWLSLLLLVGVAAIAVPELVETNGTIEISTVDQLKEFRDAVNSGTTFAGKTVKLTADLDLSSESNWTPIGNLVAYPGQSFNGTFDGDGHSISNVTSSDITTVENAVAGLFGSVVNGTIKNLTVKNVNITSTHFAAGIVAYTSNGPTIENCKVIGGTITSTPELKGSSYDNGDKVGGIMGYATAGSTINNCTVEGVTITAYRDMGGIVGFSAGTVTNNTAINVTVTQDLTNGYKDPAPTTFGDIIGRDGGATLSNNKVIKGEPVAKIGEEKYYSLADAVAAAQQKGGAVTVELIDDISGETVTIKEVANFKLTIDGNNKTVDAVIVVDGLRGNGGSTTNGASVTLQNIAFVKTTSTDGIQASHYAHHLTIQDCTYSGSDNDKWFLNASVDGPLYGVTVKNVTVEHARLIYANMADDAVFQNITATNDCKVGFNVKTSGTALIENCQVTTGKYAFRDYTDGYEGTFTLKDNTFISTTTASDEGAIVNRGGAVGTAHINVESGTYTGTIKVMNSKEGVLAISGGYFSEEFPQEYIAADLVAQGKVCTPATDMEGFFTIGDPHYVAQIGEAKYVSLQAALDAAHEMTGDVTVELLDNISGYSIVHQKSGLNLTIDGKENTVAGQIIIDGDGRAAGTETLTIQNIKFEDDLSNFYTGTDAFILVPSTKDANTPYTTGKYNYAHNITITDCSFNSTADAFKAVGFKSNSGAGCYNLVMSSVTGDNLHSLAQLTGTTGATFDNCSATLTGSFIGANGGGGTYTVSNCTFESHPDKADGYAYREKSSSTAVATLTNNNFKAHDAIILGSAGTINVESGTYVGEVSKTAGTIVISGGQFSADLTDITYEPYIAEGKIGVQNNAVEGAPYSVEDGTYVAQVTIGESTHKYGSLEAAISAAPDGATVTLLANSSGNGIQVPQGKYSTGLTVDFGGYTYTMDGEMVGSTGTQTQAFQLLKDNKITFQNGTIYSEKAKMLVQNYSDLTLEGMTLTLDNANYTPAYTLSNNNGKVVIDGTTINANPAGGFAFDVCRYSSYPSVSVTMKGESVINGDVEVSASGSDAKDGFSLMLESGNITGNIVVDATARAAIEATPDKAVIKENDSFDQAAPAGFKWVSNNDETSTLTPMPYVAQIGDVKYWSLAEAVAAVPADGTETTITMIANEMINVSGYAITIPATKKVVLDLNGFQVVGTAEGGSTSALITNKGTLTIKDSSDTNRDGSGTGKLISGASTTWTWDGTDDYTGSYASNLIRNEKDLIVESGYLFNMSTGSASYAIDNYNAGNVTINGGKVDAAKASAIRMFYPSGASITVNGGIIGGENNYMGIQAQNGSNANVSINGGTISGQYALYGTNSNGSVSISGGTFYGYVGMGSAYKDDISITGGAFNTWAGTWGNQTKFISGGIFKYDNLSEASLADGYILTDNTDPETKDAYPYTVKQGQFVAQIGTKKYETLEEAWNAVNDGETITLLANCAGNGLIAPQGKFTNGLTVDFGEFTYTVDGTTVGSTGTETLAFQLLKDNKITFKNGTIYSEKAKMLVQNYSDLTLEGMTLTLDNPNYAKAYTLSNNNGSVVIDGTTINANPAGSTAFDVCRYSSYTSVNVTVKGDSKINGDIEFDAGSGDPKDGANLTVEGGTITGNLRLTSGGSTALTDHSDKASVTKSDAVELAAPADFKWVSNSDGTSTLKPCEYVAQIEGGAKYESLEAAFAAAQDGETITLLANTSGNGIKAPQGKFTNGVTVDFAGFTYTMDGATVGSTGTETQAFQLLKDNKITFKNGTITSSVAKMLVQNYSNLTLEGMTLTLNNANYASAYTLSNNNGNVVIDGTTINANPAGGFAFDVCRYSSYPSVNVTVTGNSVINGDVEVSASGSNAKDGFELMFESATLNGEIVLDASAKTAMANTPDKAKVSKSNTLTDIVAPDDYDWKDNGDGTSSLALTEEMEMILIDGEPYPVSKTATYKKVTYRRTFTKDHKKNLQAWYVPFNYTITANDVTNFQFYKIHMIANSKEAGGTVTSQDYIYIYIEPLATGYELKANVPYLVRPLNILTDHDFVMENIVLNAPKTTSTKHLETSEHKYDFYGCYNEYKPSYTGECYWMSASGLLTPGSSAYSLKSYRWYLKQTVNDFNVDAKATFVFVESEDGEATGINGTSIESSDEIEGVYSSNGVKLDTPQKGMNIIRYKNGKTKKIMVK